MSKISEVQETKNRLLANATEMVQRGLKTPEQKEEYTKILAAIDAEQDMLEMLQKVERALPNLPAPAPVVAPPAAPQSKEQRRANLNAAWRGYLQGRLDNRIQEHRDIISTVAGGGGAVVPQEFSGFLSEALKYYAPIFDYANVRFNPNGRGEKISRVTDNPHGLTLVTEGSATLPQVDPTFSSSFVSTDLFTTGATRFSNQLLSDSFFDLEKLLTNLTSFRVGRGIETLLTLGTDSSSTTTPNNPGLINIAQTATTTGTIAAGIGWTDLTNTFDSLDVAYLPKAIWQMSSKTRNFLASLKDSTGRAYFTPATDGGLDYLLGCPIVLNQTLASPTAGVFAANAMPILFGSLFDGLQVLSSEVRVETLRERYAEFNESAIVVSTRLGSASLQAGAIQALKIAAA
jgi:HK97 family phage major capsid protein